MWRRFRKKAASILLIFSIPFLCGIIMQDEEQDVLLKRKISDAGFRVAVTDATGSYTYDPEELIPYMIAAVVPFGTEEQLVQALAILCRTNLVYCWEESGRPEQIPYEECGLPICSFFEYKELLRYKINSAEDKEDDIKRAVEATEGIILLYEGDVIKAPFFYLSAGQTRAGNGDTGQTYLQNQSCENDIYHEKYLNKYYFEKDLFWERLESLMPESIEGEQMTQRELNEWVLLSDEAGYIGCLFYKKEQIYIDIVRFCEEFDLCSPCFEIEEREKEIVLVTRGVGHGFGLNISHAKKQAQDGMSCYDILNYYFANTKKDKGYNVNVG
ncbi:MAG: hypothetical protein E7290_07930 [Lachnospiraceae bacterium]|nr:hypothetical protein [Lachnospiraceae bacterium]